MLVLSRKTNERIRIGDNITVTIIRIGPSSVRIGIDAPPEVKIVREEIHDFTIAGHRNANAGQSLSDLR